MLYVEKLGGKHDFLLKIVLELIVDIQESSSPYSLNEILLSNTP